MTAPSYFTDLQGITLATDNTGWSELSGHTSGGADSTEDTVFIQGITCVSQSTGVATGTNTGMEFDYGSDMSGSMAAGYCFFIWHMFLQANAIATWDNGGMRFGVGSSSGNMNFWKSLGSDEGRNPYGGWQNKAIDPTYTPDYTDGSPSAGNYTIFGSWPNIVSAVNKGNPHCVDAIRFGRGQLLCLYGSSGDGYANFVDLSAKNDANDATNGYNRWGLFQNQFGSYLWKGLLSIGSASTACEFVDANRFIVVDDCPRTYTEFNKIEINNSSTVVDLASITFKALASSIGTDAPGYFEMVDNATVGMDACNFIDMGEFIFDSNATLTNCLFQRCLEVTQGAGTFTGCTFDQSRAAVALNVGNDIANVSDCAFISDGTGYAMEGFSTATTYTLDGCTFDGYASSDGSTGNECIHVLASSGTVTINYTGDLPTIHSEGATVNVVSSVSVTFNKLKDNSEVLVLNSSTGAIIAHIEDATSGSEDNRSYTWSASASTVVDYIIHCFQPGDTIYESIRVEGYTVPSTNTSIDIQQRLDRNAEN